MSKLTDAIQSLIDATRSETRRMEDAGCFSTSAIWESPVVRESADQLASLMADAMGQRSYADMTEENEKRAQAGERVCELAEFVQGGGNLIAILNSAMRVATEVEGSMPKDGEPMLHPAVFMFASKILDLIGRHP